MTEKLEVVVLSAKTTEDLQTMINKLGETRSIQSVSYSTSSTTGGTTYSAAVTVAKGRIPLFD